MTFLTKRAIEFAVAAHAGQCRKGTDIPYITHPFEVALLLAEAGANETLIAAGLLHDTIEDAGVTADEIRNAFGAEVLALVNSDSEDKSLPWEARKQATLDLLACASREERLLALADKLSNLRSMVRDHDRIGDALWTRFRRGYAAQKWYYTGIANSLAPLSGLPAYQELTALCDSLFGAERS